MKKSTYYASVGGLSVAVALSSAIAASAAFTSGDSITTGTRVVVASGTSNVVGRWELTRADSSVGVCVGLRSRIGEKDASFSEGCGVAPDAVAVQSPGDGAKPGAFAFGLVRGTNAVRAALSDPSSAASAKGAAVASVAVKQGANGLRYLAGDLPTAKGSDAEVVLQDAASKPLKRVDPLGIAAQ